MSKRREIIKDVIDTIKKVKTPKLGVVTGKAEDLTRLARTAFPHVRVDVASETAEDIAMDSRLATLQVSVQVSLLAQEKGLSAEEQMSKIIEAIEEKLEKDRKRNKQAQTTELLEVSELESSAYPITQSTMTYNIQYTYTRGNR